MDQDSSEKVVPAFDVGIASVPVYYLPIIALVVLLGATAYRKTTSQTRDWELKNHPEELEACSTSIQRQKWTAPHIGWELLRILACITPMAIFFCLVDFGCSCLPWLSVLFDEPAPPPSLDGVGLFGGYLFLVVWVIASYPGDEMRPYRRPRATMWLESWFCARAAGWSLAILLAVWAILKAVYL
jgi:hypothetical protein